LPSFLFSFETTRETHTSTQGERVGVDMSKEREIVTVALGNYSTLVGAQWANGLSRLDMEQETLSIGTRSARFGSSGGTSSLGGGDGRVPRLVVLDNHHSCRMVRNDLHVGDPEPDVDPFLNTQDDDGDDDDVPFDDFSYITTVGGAASSKHRDPHRRHNDEDADDDAAEEDEEVPRHIPDGERDMRLRQRDENNAKAIFRHKDVFVPWHQYIRAGLHPRSYAALADEHRESRGVSLLHSVGYGKARMHTSNVAEMDATFETIRYMLEAADHPQGCQLFVDGDSCFGGLGANLMHEIRESWGTKLSLFTNASFEPFPDLDIMDDDFAQIRLDEVDLNFALSTVYLSESSSCYVPCCVGQWGAFQDEAVRNKWSLPPVPSSNDNTATAQIIATAWDTATYGLRGGGGDGGDASRPQLYMSELERIARPSDGYRVASLFSSLPYRVHHVADGKKAPCFWTALGRNPLFPISGAPPRPREDGRPSSPSATSNMSTFFPLSHTNASGPDSDAGRILSHSLTVRGIKGLRDEAYPRQEAIMRHLYPLRTASVQATFTEDGYPISDTFPSTVLFPSAPEGSATSPLRGVPLEGLTHVPTAAHLCCTYNAGGMLSNAASRFDNIRRLRRHVHREAFLMEDDEWVDVSEQLHQLKDDYCHQGDDDDFGEFDD
jgi:hypothetical protein